MTKKPTVLSVIGGIGNAATIVAMAVVVVVTLLALKFIFKRPAASLGFVSKSWILKYGKGLLLGGIFYTVVYLALAAIGAIKIQYNFQFSSIGMIFMAFGFTAFQAMAEEIVFRGYLVNELFKSLKLIPTVLITALVFTLPHISNYSKEGNLLGLLAVFSLSLVFNIIFAKTRNLWLVGGFHAAWNLFSFQVFVADNPTAVFTYTVTKGMESAEVIVATIASLLLSIALLVFWKKSRSAEV